MISQLYRQAIDCQIPPTDFWNYSPMEIYDLTESYYRRQRYTIKQQVMQDFIPAEVHARYITLEKNKDVPHPWEYYPMLFIEEEQQHKEVLKEKELEAYKDARRAYISEFNRRRQGN